MAMKVPNYLLRHRITFDLYAGSGPMGPTYGDSITVRAHVISGKPVKVSVGAEEITADTVVYIRPDRAIPLRSQSIYNGEKYTVVQVTNHYAPGLPTPDHIKLLLVPYTSGSIPAISG